MNQIDIYGDIGESFWGESITASSVKDQLKEMKGDVTVRINSGGGSVFEGFAMYNLLKAHDGKVTTINDGIAASAASTVFMAGDERITADNALTMIHNPWSLAFGDAEEMRNTANLLDKIKGSIIKTYTAGTDLSDDEVSNMMSDETWLDADEAIKQGFATDKAEDSSKAVANMDKPWINKAPKIEKTDNDAVAESINIAAINSRNRKLKLLMADA